MTRQEFDKLVTEWMEAFTKTERLFAIADKKRLEREKAQDEYDTAQRNANFFLSESQRREQIIKQAMRDGVTRNSNPQSPPKRQLRDVV